jgi:hypothetical protein
VPSCARRPAFGKRAPGEDGILRLEECVRAAPTGHISLRKPWVSPGWATLGRGRRGLGCPGVSKDFRRELLGGGGADHRDLRDVRDRARLAHAAPE